MIFLPQHFSNFKNQIKQDFYFKCNPRFIALKYKVCSIHLFSVSNLFDVKFLNKMQLFLTTKHFIFQVSFFRCQLPDYLGSETLFLTSTYHNFPNPLSTYKWFSNVSNHLFFCLTFFFFFQHTFSLSLLLISCPLSSSHDQTITVYYLSFHPHCQRYSNYTNWDLLVPSSPENEKVLLSKS